MDSFVFIHRTIVLILRYAIIFTEKSEEKGPQGAASKSSTAQTVAHFEEIKVYAEMVRSKSLVTTHYSIQPGSDYSTKSISWL